LVEREVLLVKRDGLLSKSDVADLLLLLVLALGFWVAFGMLKPYLDAILIAGLFAVILNPIYQRLLSLLGGRRSLVAVLTSLILIAVVVIPCFIVIWRLIQEAAAFSHTIVQWLSSESFMEFMKKPIVVRLTADANRYIAEFNKLAMGKTGQGLQINQLAIQIVTYMANLLVGQGSYIAGHAVALLGNFLLMIFAFFFMIRDQEELRCHIFRVLPFTHGHEEEICLKVVSLCRSTFLGIFLTAFAQGMGAAVGFWVTGIPVVFGSVAAAFASLIPIVGTSVVWLPATLYLLFTNHVGAAIFLTIWWAVVVVFLLDDVLRPLVMSGGAEMSMPLVLFFIVGGIRLFGLLGVLYGPLILGALYLLGYLYELTIVSSGTRPSNE
jgi:predicted PurR-regulated permease PerM